MTVIAKNLTCMRQQRTVFHDLNFTMQPGELLQVVGENGAGKSSLLRIVAGLLAPQAGTVTKTDAATPLFYLGHTLGIKSSLTVKENIMIGIKDFAEVDDALSAWSLLSLADQRAESLSQGQKKRLTLARLALSQAKLWILDEPFAGLDSQGVEKLVALFQQHLNVGGSILLATHQVDTRMMLDVVARGQLLLCNNVAHASDLPVYAAN